MEFQLEVIQGFGLYLEQKHTQSFRCQFQCAKDSLLIFSQTIE